MLPNLLRIQNSSDVLTEILRSKANSKYKLLHILNFYALAKDYPDPDSLYSYYIQFIEELVILVEKENFHYCNPEDIDSLIDFISYLKNQPAFNSVDLLKSEDKLNNEKNRIISFLSGAAEQNSKTDLTSSDSVNIALIEQDTNSVGIRCGTIGKMKIDEIIPSDRGKVKFNNHKNEDGELPGQLIKSVNVAKMDLKEKFNYRFSYEFEDSELMYDGSSLGCGAACLAYNSMFRSGLHNFYYRFRDDAVITGAVDESGNLIPLSEESIKLKLETVFYSEYKSFVIPKDNFNVCYSLLEELNKKYPERKLLLVPVEKYKEVLENTNVTVRHYLKFKEKVNAYYNKYQKVTNVAAMVVIFTAIIYTGLGIIIPKLDKNPVKVEYSDNKYILKNKYDEPVWESEKIGQGRDWFAKNSDVTYNNSVFLDLDNDDAKDLLYVKSTENKLEYESAVYISSGDSEKVFYGIPLRRLYNKRGDTLLSSMNITHLNILDSARFGKDRFIFNAKHRFFPQVIGVLDYNGNLLSQFWNYGHIELFYKDDFDKDGKTEYYFGGSNNKDNCAVFTVFDPEFIDGASPEFDITGNNNAGTEKYYINIPGSKLLEKSDNMRNFVIGIKRSSDSSIFVLSTEMVYRDSTGTMVQPYLMYSFDKSMNCIRVVGDDFFTKIYNREQKENPELEPLREYYETLRKQVMWWDGDKYVNERAVNKEYLKRLESK